jgi:LEA14-like dessication related protein
MFNRPLYLLLLIAIWTLHGCTSLEKAGQAMSESMPTGHVKGVNLSNMDIKGIDLVFDLQVDNPNPVTISLDHLDYELSLLDNTFLKGEQSMGMKLAADGSSQVKVPVRMGFKQLQKIYSKINKRGELPYAIDLGLGLDLPLLGRIRVPVSHQGSIPIPKIPDIAIHRVEVEHLTLQKADVMFELEVTNPNQFAVMLNRLNYQLKLNGIDVAKGISQQPGKIKQQGKGLLKLPLSLDLVKAGTGIYQALVGGSGLRYQLNGSVDASSDHAMIGNIQIPLDKQGQIDLN